MPAAASPAPPGLAPPPFLQLAAHPLRWRLLQELGRSDLRVHELTERVGEPQNLVSYHLGKLKAGALVTARRSSADGRDSYYSVDLAGVRSSLADAGAALHPGLAARAEADAGPGPVVGRVLYLCTGNSARSQMAEAITTARSHGRVEARSAGSHPKALHPDAVRVLREHHGIDISGAEAKPLSSVADERFDRVITLCDRVREICPELPGRPEAIHWSLPDPAADHGAGTAGYPAFVRAAAELESRIGFLLAGWRMPRPPTERSAKGKR